LCFSAAPPYVCVKRKMVALTADDIDCIIAYLVPFNLWYVLPVEAFSPCKNLWFYPHGSKKGIAFRNLPRSLVAAFPRTESNVRRGAALGRKSGDAAIAAPSSREAAPECSPGRKPWVRWGKDIALKGRRIRLRHRSYTLKTAAELRSARPGRRPGPTQPVPLQKQKPRSKAGLLLRSEVRRQTPGLADD
jgi:hypothetical protein